jgi:hypothetical protein
MIKIDYDDGVLPRPVERLPDLANAKSRHVLADKLIEAFDLSSASAAAIASAVVNPSDVRKSIGEPTDPDVERIPVPGGTLLGIRTNVWARRTMPDPRNPRILPSRKHPFAIDPGTGGEDSKFRPVPEPQPLHPEYPAGAELAVEIESRHHLLWASQLAAHYVLAENDWRMSIASQGVMEAVWLVATTYIHQNGDTPVTTLTTVEGSSRDTAVHNILQVNSADVPYDSEDSRMRSRIKKLNDAFDRGDLDSEGQIAMRCERIPALILVGFVPHSGGATGFPTAIKSLVALRHVDPPKPWGEGPENESLADEVLDELYRRNLITETKRDYFAGSCTKAEALAAHLSDDPVLRASEIIHLFTTDDEAIHDAIHVAVTSQSTRKRMTQKLMNDLATALILRAVSDDRNKVDQTRRYLRYAFGKAVHREEWVATGRPTQQLVKEALKEVRQSLANADKHEPGPASLELAVRASYPLVVTGRLNADRGTSNNDQPDRRNPGEVLDAMRRSVQGVLQLGTALDDFAADRPIRAVDEDGTPRLLADGSGEQNVSDVYLRNEYPPAGKAKSARPGDTPSDYYDRAVEALANSFLDLEKAFEALGQVKGDDDQPIVDSRGVEVRLTEKWRELLGRVDEEAVIWTRTYRKACGAQPISTVVDVDDDYENDDPYSDEEDDELVM